MVRLVILRILESYFRHRWLYILPIILMTGLGVASVFLKEPAYIASGVLYIDKESILSNFISLQENAYSWDTPAAETSGEISELLQTDAFIRAVIMMTDLEDEMNKGETAVSGTIELVREATWTEAIGDNQLLVSAADPDPQLSYQLVNSVVENYIQWKINSDRVESATAQDFFGDLIVQYRSEMEIARRELTNYLIAHPAPDRGDRPELELMEVERLQSDLQLAETRYAQALENDESVQLALSQAENQVRRTYFFIDAPDLPKEPSVSLKEVAIQIAIFIIIGGMITVIGIAGSILLDRSLKFPLDVHNALELPVLASVPDVSEFLAAAAEKMIEPETSSHKKKKKRRVSGREVSEQDVLQRPQPLP